MREKRICGYEGHPFKQKWYRFDPDFDHPVYCSSCRHFLNITATLIKAAMMPRETLYAHKQISLSRERAHALVDGYFDMTLETL